MIDSLRLRCFKCDECSMFGAGPRTTAAWAVAHYEATTHSAFGRYMPDGGLSTLVLRVDPETKELYGGCCGRDHRGTMHEDKDDLKTQLPNEDLKESLGKVDSDLRKRVESEPLHKRNEDTREGSDVL